MSEEKDRYGNKLRDKEKGEENRYFAEQERAQLEKLRQKAAPGPLGLCPRCGLALVARDYHGVAIDDCPKCGGIWLDKGQVESVVEREDETWAHRWLRNVLAGLHR